MAKKQGNTITVQAGDSWAKIAGELYGDQRMFEELMRANKNISMLRPGQTLVLPKKRENPYVSGFGAAATGMATEFNAQGQPLNTPANPLVPQGTNVMSSYGMYQARQNAQSGGYQTSGASGIAPPPAPTTTAPKPPAQQQYGVAGAGSVGAAPPAPTGAAPYTFFQGAQNVPKPVPPTVAGQYGVAGAGSVRPPTQQQPTAPQPGAGGAAAIAGAAQAGQMVNIAGTGAQYSSGVQSGTFAPFTFFQGAQAQGPGSQAPTTPAAQQAAAITPPVGAPTPTPATAAATAPLTGQAAAIQWAKQEGQNMFANIKAALNGAPDTVIPNIVHGSQVQNMAFSQGLTSQQVANSLLQVGYVFDASTNSLVLPGSQTSAFGGPNLGGQNGQGAVLPEYRAPTYGSPQFDFVRGKRGQILRKNRGGGQEQAQAALPMQLYQQISANWRI